MPATVQDALDAIAAAKARVDSDVATLNQTIVDLQNQLGSASVDLQPVVDAANAIDPAPVVPEPAPTDVPADAPSADVTADPSV